MRGIRWSETRTLRDGQLTFYMASLGIITNVAVAIWTWESW
jgi:hypothetical protein